MIYVRILNGTYKFLGLTIKLILYQIYEEGTNFYPYYGFKFKLWVILWFYTEHITSYDFLANLIYIKSKRKEQTLILTMVLNVNYDLSYEFTMKI